MNLQTAIERSNEDEVTAALTSVYITGLRHRIAKVETDFGDLGIRASEWARQESAKLITGISSEDERLVRNLVSRAVQQGWTDEQLADRVASYVGLTPRQANAVEAYRIRMVSDGIAPGIARRNARAYAQRLRSQRTRTVARYEVQRALNAAQLGIWRDMRETGELPKWVTRRLVVHKDDRLCAVCGPINGRRASLDIGGGYQTSNGFYEFPPFHVNCRCYEQVEADVVNF